jgi:hypothetical protein
MRQEDVMVKKTTRGLADIAQAGEVTMAMVSTDSRTVAAEPLEPRTNAWLAARHLRRPKQSGRGPMIRGLMMGVVSVAALALSAGAFAQQGHPTAQEARAMLDKVVAAVKTDKTKALDMFNKGEGGFRDRDLYPFCFNISDGKIVAVGNPHTKGLLGMDRETLKGATKGLGLDVYTAAQKPEGEITEVSYLFPKPGADATLAPKVSFVTRVGDLGCGVGYYK